MQISPVYARTHGDRDLIPLHCVFTTLILVIIFSFPKCLCLLLIYSNLKTSCQLYRFSDISLHQEFNLAFANYPQRKSVAEMSSSCYKCYVYVIL